MYRIIISLKAYSSWSLRGWLLLDAFGLPYEESFVPLYDPAFDAMKAEKAPARTVPILEWTENGQTARVWDSLAIAETLAERHPEAGIWPKDAGHRTIARILAAEMHSGLTGLRSHCPMNFHRNNVPLQHPPESVAADAARTGELWTWALEASGGPWLAGPDFSAADVFFAPLASRLQSYGLTGPQTEAYTARVLSHPSAARWIAAAHAETARLAVYDDVT